jgi:hypothetical protein
VLETAAETGRVLLSGDTDFGELLAASNASSPSVVLFRRQGQRRAGQIAALLLMNLATVEADLEAGAVVVFDNDRIRVRALPMQPLPNRPPCGLDRAGGQRTARNRGAPFETDNWPDHVSSRAIGDRDLPSSGVRVDADG